MIVDDRAVVRYELRTVLELRGGIPVAGEAADGREALRQARALKPDIVLMDLEMPGMGKFCRAGTSCPAVSYPPITLQAHEDGG